MRTNCIKLDSLRLSFELIARCQMATTDAQIDSLVYDLDRLIGEEIKIVEGTI